MMLSVNRMGPVFAAELIGADLNGALTPDLVNTVREAMDAHGVLVIRDADIDDAAQVRFSCQFGALELPPTLGLRPQNGFKPRVAPEVYDVSNLSASGEIEPADSARRSFKSDQFFHSDSSFNLLPTTWSLLSARVLPPAGTGGDTEFIDMRAVYAALDDGTKAEIETLEGEHCFTFGLRLGGWEPPEAMQAKFPIVAQKLVKRAPDGRKTLFAGAHCGGIVGWPADKGRALLRRLIDFAREDRFRYIHKWRPHDLLIWDNRTVLHRVTPYDSFTHVREMRRTTLLDQREDACGVAA